MEGNSKASLASTGRFAREQAERLLGHLAVQVARTIRSGGAAEAVVAVLKGGWPKFLVNPDVKEVASKRWQS